MIKKNGIMTARSGDTLQVITKEEGGNNQVIRWGKKFIYEMRCVNETRLKTSLLINGGRKMKMS